MTTARLLLVLGLLCAGLALVLVLRPAHRAAVVRADPVRTPGALNPDVTQATLRATVCRSGWTRTVRPPVDYTNGLKRRQMRAYREHGPPSAYQEDHLISLELGGAPADPRNLWPEPYPRAAEMDRVENDLNAQVCTGRLTLHEAQVEESAMKHRDG